MPDSQTVIYPDPRLRATERAPPERTVRRFSVVDADGYRRSVKGVEISATRIGQGSDASHGSTVHDEHIAITTASVGFPMANSATTSDDVAAFVAFRSGAPGMRWDGFDVHDGLMLEFGPASDHVGTNLEGSQYAYVIIDVSALEERAAVLGIPFEPAPRGSVRDVSAKPLVDSAARLMMTLGSLRDGTAPPPPLMDDLLSAFTRSLGLGAEGHSARQQWHADDRTIIRRCVEFAASLDRRPSLSELCVAARSSERTVRDAFVREYGLPPSVYFRFWALNRAYQRLTSGDRIPGGISEVALAAGFGHLGRFSRYYREAFGELPSATYGVYSPVVSRRGLRRVK